MVTPLRELCLPAKGRMEPHDRPPRCPSRWPASRRNSKAAAGSTNELSNLALMGQDYLVI